jgi:hypothetical protein
VTKFTGDKAAVMKEFGQLKRLGLRSVWAKEAYDFTPWLADNIQRLGEALGMDLELDSREASVGDFSLDLLAKDLSRSRTVIIENQLTPTDHDHLGKLLTYAAGFNATAIVWIAESIREEHRQALEWLNQRTDEETEFFGVIVEVLQIDNSKPAFNFKLVVFPNEWQKTKNRTATSTTTKGEAYRAYFQELIDELREKHKFTGARVGQPQSWYHFGAEMSGAGYGASFALGGRVRVEVYIDQGEWESNKQIFDQLFNEKEAIEREFGEALEWERLDDKRASRIAIYRPGSIMSDAPALQEIRAWTINQLLKFKKVFGPQLKKHGNAVKRKSLSTRPDDAADDASVQILPPPSGQS